MWSKAFIEELSKTPWKTGFQFVCVDPSPSRPKLPAWLTKVPTLVIQGEQQPRTDGEVMNWLSEMKMKHGGNTGAPSAMDSSSEPEAFSLMEQTSFAKGFGYSFQDADTTTQGNGGSTIPGAFSFLNGSASPGDRTGNQIPSMASVERRSKKEQMFDQAMEAYQNERNLGVPQARPPAL